MNTRGTDDLQNSKDLDKHIFLYLPADGSLSYSSARNI